MNKTDVAFLCIVAAATAATARAQGEAPKLKSSESYRLEFVLKEMDGGKPVRTHNYQTILSVDYGSSIRDGSKIPVPDSKGITYIDVGVNIDTRKLIRTKDGLELDMVVESSGAMDAGTGAQSGKAPVIRQMKWDTRGEIPVGKSTTVFSFDDPSSKHQMQLEVTATPLH